ncbi:MAG TPA: hypothetical protein VKR38_17590 [Usitatibacter sp.]|nr:hypothetical protein [Usitatibacter sp.]
MKSGLHFQHPNARGEFERLRGSVRESLGNTASGDVVRAVEELEEVLDAGVRRLKPGLVGSTLHWDPADRGVSEWIYLQHCALADLARRAADLLERREGACGMHALRVTALAFLHWGEAAKWIVNRRERLAFGWIHYLMRNAIEGGCNLHPCEVRLDGRQRVASLESLFLRALFLDRFAGGNLSGPQLEVLDAWLWEWMPDLRCTRAWPGDPAFRVDLDGNGGLRRGERTDGGPSLYLPIAPLEARRRALIEEFHRGRIVPSVGVASDLRLEEHIAVLDHLRAAFEAKREKLVERKERRPVAGDPIEVCVGVAEILLRGFGGATASSEGLSAAKASLSDTQRLRQVQFASEYEASRRILRLVDISDSGYGFEATEKEAANLAVDDLVSLRLARDEGCVLGRVTRRVPGAILGHVTIGIEELSDHPRSITLSRTTADGRREDEAFIYVAGSDACGKQDSFIAPEKSLRDMESRDACIAGQRFTLRFNRVRRSGRGWALVGFEILGVEPVKPVETSVVVPVRAKPVDIQTTAAARARAGLVTSRGEGIEYDL